MSKQIRVTKKGCNFTGKNPLRMKFENKNNVKKIKSQLKELGTTWKIKEIIGDEIKIICNMIDYL